MREEVKMDELSLERLRKLGRKIRVSRTESRTRRLQSTEKARKILEGRKRLGAILSRF